MTGTFGFRVGPDAGGSVKVEGLSKLRRELKALGGDLDLVKGEFLATNKAVAEIVIGDSKRYVPVDSGALATSIRNASTKTAAKIRVGSSGKKGSKSGGDLVEYAGPIHFGWPARRIKPQPFIYEATDQRRNEISMKSVSYTHLTLPTKRIV